jgi:hypothetical protein
MISPKVLCYRSLRRAFACVLDWYSMSGVLLFVEGARSNHNEGTVCVAEKASVQKYKESGCTMDTYLAIIYY